MGRAVSNVSHLGSEKPCREFSRPKIESYDDARGARANLFAKDFVL